MRRYRFGGGKLGCRNVERLKFPRVVKKVVIGG